MLLSVLAIEERKKEEGSNYEKEREREEQEGLVVCVCAYVKQLQKRLTSAAHCLRKLDRRSVVAAHYSFAPSNIMDTVSSNKRK